MLGYMVEGKNAYSALQRLTAWVYVRTGLCNNHTNVQTHYSSACVYTYLYRQRKINNLINACNNKHTN